MAKNIHTERLLQEALNQVQTGNHPFRFILMGGGSGNVYAVSNATDINAALKEVSKDIPLLYSGTETPEADDISIMLKKGGEVKHYDGYVILTIPRSDEGQFALLDITSTNPDVQAEIKTLNLIKYANEFIEDKKALDND